MTLPAPDWLFPGRTEDLGDDRRHAGDDRLAQVVANGLEQPLTLVRAGDRRCDGDDRGHGDLASQRRAGDRGDVLAQASACCPLLLVTPCFHNILLTTERAIFAC